MKEFLQKYCDSYSVREWGEGFLLMTPIMYKGADHTFSFYLVKNDTGSFRISDRGQTLDYMRENFDPEQYRERIDAVCERFEIERVGDELIGRVASYESGQTMRGLLAFVGAVSTIVNVDLLA